MNLISRHPSLFRTQAAQQVTAPRPTPHVPRARPLHVSAPAKSVVTKPATWEPQHEQQHASMTTAPVTSQPQHDEHQHASTTAAAPSAPPTLSQRLGGLAAIKAVTEIFYIHIMADPALIPFFDGVDMRKQKARQAQFLAYVFSSGAYKGSYLRTAHLRLIKDKGMHEGHFDLVAGHLVAALLETGVPQPLIDEVVDKVMPTKDIIFKPAPGELEASAAGAAVAVAEVSEKGASPSLRCPFSRASAAADAVASTISRPGASAALAAAGAVALALVLAALV